ncbi:MAG TPA: hypothetical protein VK578_23975 [Edaphobacter sp.]|nr:hypothetical protein [Edaphobacter sp.]
MFELGIRFGNSCGTDHKLLRERTDTWEWIAVLKYAFLDGVSNLLHELQVEGLSGD